MGIISGPQLILRLKKLMISKMIMVHQQNHKRISAFLGLSATFPLADKSQQVY
jgi:hypothetical protein